jgi:phosphatidylinositol glycan class A protein
MSAIWFKIRLAVYTVTLLTVSLWAVVIAFVATCCGARLNTNYYVARTFYAVAGTIMGWTIDLEGEEYLWEGYGKGDKAKGVQRSAVMIGNHQS